MTTTTSRISAAPESPLERFVRDYVEVRGGAWDEIEPQVYDLMVDEEILRVAFDPEALPDHPRAQLASFGSPLIDRMLQDAVRRGSRARLYANGANLHPHDLVARVRRGLQLAAGLAPVIEHVRAMHFPQAIFWFEGSFVSDQKEEEIIPVGIDLHYGREVRHLANLLEWDRLSESPPEFLPDARRVGLRPAYRSARRSVVRTVAALANARRRELAGRTDRQAARMTRYYAQLREELDEQAAKAASRGEDAARFAQRRDAVEREAALRIAELRQKSAVRVNLRLLNLLVVEQPKLLLRTSVVEVEAKAARGQPRPPIEIVWDPMTDSIEPIACPGCGSPTLSLTLDSRGRLACPGCSNAPRATVKQVVAKGQKSHPG